MKNSIILFILIGLMGCGFVVHEDKKLRTVGIREPEARETIAFIEERTEDQKTRIWPLGQK